MLEAKESSLGLRGSPRLWFLTLADFLKPQGFLQYKGDPFVFYNESIFILFVDGIVMMYSKKATASWKRIHGALMAARS